jgi:hypothetical protein
MGGDFRATKPPCAHAIEIVFRPTRAESLPGVSAIDRDIAIIRDEFDRLAFAR